MDVETWERRAEVPLGLAALVFLGAYAWPILDPGLSGTARDWCRACDWTIWVTFGVDYVIRLGLARGRRARFVRVNIVDLLILALPMLRPLRLLRLVLLLRILNRGATDNFRGRVAAYVVAAVTIVVLTASLAELDAERGQPGASIETIGDSLWWAATTITTVGYGDLYPVTTTGRLVAMALMVCGIALLGIVTATLATWLLDQVQAGEDQTQAELRALARQVEALHAVIAASSPPGAQAIRATTQAQEPSTD